MIDGTKIDNIGKIPYLCFNKKRNRMKKSKPYKVEEPEKTCVHEPMAGYISEQHSVVGDETKDEFEQLWKRGIDTEEFRRQTKLLIREMAAERYGKK